MSLNWMLKRCKTMWNDVEVQVPRAIQGFRVNKFNSTMVHHEIELNVIQQVSATYDYLKRTLAGRCVDLQLVFDGPLPKADLKSLGFEKREGESRIWNLKHPEYHISAISIDSTNSWILEVIKRSGKGILKDAAELDFIPVSFEPVQTNLFGEVIRKL
ncbi:hypothetical protein J2T17_004410 [Paenibacillus mucilaginosus]|uniref:hypothetical protein n=1 Tax=Paenibacillus mucilaginosus TaxID=61624 RepID=UPI003D22714E